MDAIDLFPRFALALGIGLLIGLERGWRERDEKPGQRTAGIRTFALIGLLGGLFGALAGVLDHAEGPAGAILLGIAFAAFAVAFALFCREENRAEDRFSATTMVAGLLTFALGSFAILGDPRMAAAAAVATAALLAMRERLHGLLTEITFAELRAALMLLAMTFIALPLIPDRALGPFGGVNLREIWLIAIVLAAVSFAGYIAVRYYGSALGILVAALAGGLVSSTAVTVTCARDAAAAVASPRILAAAATLATAVSFVRALVLVLVFNPDVAVAVAGSLVVATATAVAASFALVHSEPGAPGGGAPRLRNPFDLASVLGFAILLGVVILAARLATENFGAGGAMITAALGGVADIDAVIVSVVRLAPGSLSVAEAGAAVLLAVGANIGAKFVIGAALGGRRFAGALAAATSAIFAGGVVAAWLSW